MSIFKCNRCPSSTASQWLLKEHEFTDHAQNIKIDPNSSKAPTTVSFGPNVAKAPTSIHVSHSVQRGYGVDDVDMNSDTESEGEVRGILKMKVILRISSMKIKICWKLLMISNQHLITVCN